MEFLPPITDLARQKILSPITSTTSYIIDSFVVNVCLYELGKSATLRIDCYCENHLFKVKTHKLEGDAFDGWGNDDDYITDYVNINLYEILEIPRPSIDMGVEESKD